jgi:hypothetical protein
LTADYTRGALFVRRLANPLGNRRHDMLWIEHADQFILIPRRGLTVVADIQGASSLQRSLDGEKAHGNSPSARPRLSDVEGWFWIVRAANATVVYALVRYLPELDSYEAEGLVIER